VRLEDVLFSQGFGTRRVCAGLIQQGHVKVQGLLVTDAGAEVQPQGLAFEVLGEAWAYHERAYIVLHKPTATECSHKPSAWPSVYSLLPTPLRQRPSKNAIQGVQAVGRLDQDTTGMLLMSDDGAFIHRMSSPKKHVPKVYQVTCKHALTPKMIERLLAGVVLDDDPKPVAAAACVATGENCLDLTLTEGKYHQVKRMIAAVGNRVEGLHRAQIGQMPLPPDLAPGQWRFLSADELLQVSAAQP
jgi:16S rRNA pseudouridine516 synthase